MASAYTPGDPFALHVAQSTILARAAFSAARPALSRLLGLANLRRVYLQSQDAPGASFEARVLRALDIRVQVHATPASRIPSVGPLIVAANHPTGALDGLVLAEVVRQVRPDVRLLANYLLARIPELRESCFFVNPFGDGAAVRVRNSGGLRAAHLWLRTGGALIVFPAGEVAAHRTSTGTCTDSTWSATVGRLARATGACVLPAFIAARNSRAFYAAGRIHPLLRTVMLGRELLKQRGTTVHVRLGAPLSVQTIGTSRTAKAATDSIRGAVDAVAGIAPARAIERPQEVIAPVDAGLLERDIRALPASTRLLSSGDHDVFCCGAEAIPNVLREIGRLREDTFRAVGEGTGRSLDIDRFDAHYDHLFVWNRSRLEIVGAYRIGATDRIVAEHGPAGLYTTTLFRYDGHLLSKISPALELGRSFVRQEYQRSYSALLLLWKGIGRLVARAPRYRVLYGPVSISARYTDMSQHLLRAFVAHHHGNAELQALVQPINPPTPVIAPRREAPAIADVGELDTLIRRCEGECGVPVLLRHYLRLEATLLGFNVDPAFGDALDALMMVDLTKLPCGTLQRYLGPAEARAFLGAQAALAPHRVCVA